MSYLSSFMQLYTYKDSLCSSCALVFCKYQFNNYSTLTRKNFLFNDIFKSNAKVPTASLSPTSLANPLTLLWVFFKSQIRFGGCCLFITSPPFLSFAWARVSPCPSPSPGRPAASRWLLQVQVLAWVPFPAQGRLPTRMHRVSSGACFMLTECSWLGQWKRWIFLGS